MRIHFALLIALILLSASPIFAQSQTDFFDPAVLQEIRLEIFPNDWETLKQHFLENTYYACDFHWNYKGKDIALPEIGIRSRGSGSRSGVKPSLRVDFNRYESGQTFLGLKSVVLRANTQDASMMHERVSMEFFRKLGLAAPRETHTKLFVNGEYVGLYTIVESVDKGFLTRNLGEDNGYLYSYDYQFPWLFQYRGADPAQYSPIPFKPETNDTNPDPKPFPLMIQAINSSSDAQFQASVGQYVDLNSLLLEVAAENFLAEQDGILGDYGLNNFYLYRFNNKTLHRFIPWDKSNTFWSLDWPIMRNTQENVLFRRALAQPSLLAVYRNAVAQAAAVAGGTGGWLEQEINQEYQQIQQAAYTDPKKLCDPGATGGLRPCSNDEFDAEIARMLDFARKRGPDVLTQLNPGLNQQTFTISNLGGFSSSAAGATSTLKVGYARIQTNAGSTSPSGLAIFSLRTGTTIVSEASVPASAAIRNGRIYAEVNGSVNTGLAIANPNDQAATLNFFFTDASGNDIKQGTITIPANGQIAQFLDSAPFNSGTLPNGSFTFTSNVPVAAIALRGLTNERNEFLMTTLPVIDLSATAATGNVYLPHFADGNGWRTQIVLVNPTDSAISGTVQFFSQGTGTTTPGTAISITANNTTATSFSYNIPKKSSFKLATAGLLASTVVGSVRVNPTTGAAPSSLVVFSFRQGGVTESEAGVPGTQGTAFRMYVEENNSAGVAGAVQTGVALTNLGTAPATANLELTRLDGSSTGLVSPVILPGNGQVAKLLHEIFPSLTYPFQGILRISGGSSAGTSVVGLRLRFNERGEILTTTTPPTDENAPAPTSELLFPHIVEGGGFTTQFILFSGRPGQSPAGTLRYLSQSGQPLTLGIQ